VVPFLGPTFRQCGGQALPKGAGTVQAVAMGHVLWKVWSLGVAAQTGVVGSESPPNERRSAMAGGSSEVPYKWLACKK